jgi:hypothetical protein
VFWKTKILKTTRSAGLLPPVPNSHQTRCFACGTDGQYAKQTNLEAVRSYQHLQREVQNPVTQRMCSTQQQVEVSSHNLREVRPADNWQSVKLIITITVLTHTVYPFLLLSILLVTLFFHLPCIYFSPLRQNSPYWGQGLLISEALRSHLDTPHSVGLLWKRDRYAAETSI